MPTTPAQGKQDRPLSLQPGGVGGTVAPSLRLGVFTSPSADWIAGSQHVANLLAALRAAEPDAVESVIVNPDRGTMTELEELDLAAATVLRYALPRRRTPRSIADSMQRRLLAVDPTADRLLAAAGVRVAFATVPMHRLRHVRTLAWIPDLQHIHLPECFSEEERTRRSASFRRCLAVSDRIVVTSASVREDLARFAPEHADKVTVLHPASAFPDSAFAADPHEVVSQYRLPEKFFYLPNHFWTHKNHALVLEAVSILRDRGARIVVAMTGMAADYRSPLHAAAFFRRVAELGLREQLLYLGIVPRRHVQLLMRQAVAVLNPSLFEGWGYSVGEATALGARVIVSDIPPHREQDPPGATFVSPRDPEALAQALHATWHEPALGRDQAQSQRAREEMGRRLAEYGRAALTLLREVTA